MQRRQVLLRARPQHPGASGGPVRCAGAAAGGASCPRPASPPAQPPPCAADPPNAPPCCCRRLCGQLHCDSPPRLPQPHRPRGGHQPQRGGGVGLPAGLAAAVRRCGQAPPVYPVPCKPCSAAPHTSGELEVGGRLRGPEERQHQNAGQAWGQVSGGPPAAAAPSQPRPASNARPALRLLSSYSAYFQAFNFANSIVPITAVQVGAAQQLPERCPLPSPPALKPHAHGPDR